MYLGVCMNMRRTLFFALGLLGGWTGLVNAASGMDNDPNFTQSPAYTALATVILNALHEASSSEPWSAELRNRVAAEPRETAVEIMDFMVKDPGLLNAGRAQARVVDTTFAWVKTPKHPCYFNMGQKAEGERLVIFPYKNPMTDRQKSFEEAVQNVWGSQGEHRLTYSKTYVAGLFWGICLSVREKCKSLNIPTDGRLLNPADALLLRERIDASSRSFLAQLGEKDFNKGLKRALTHANKFLEYKQLGEKRASERDTNNVPAPGVQEYDGGLEGTAPSSCCRKQVIIPIVALSLLAVGTAALASQAKKIKAAIADKKPQASLHASLEELLQQ
jgi:hypothetical protein